MREVTVDELVAECGDELFPCTFICRYGKDVRAFDADKARRLLSGYPAITGGPEMVEKLPLRCVWEELVCKLDRDGWDFLTDKCERVRVTDARA